MFEPMKYGDARTTFRKKNISHVITQTTHSINKF